MFFRSHCWALELKVQDTETLVHSELWEHCEPYVHWELYHDGKEWRFEYLVYSVSMNMKGYLDA